MSIKAIIYTTGYVESASIGSLVFYLKEDIEESFEDKYKAVESLSNDLFKAYCSENVSPYTVECCDQMYDTEYNKHKFCLHCGKDLKTIKSNSVPSKSFVDNNFKYDFLFGLIGNDNDSTGSIYMHLEDHGKWMWGSPSGLLHLKPNEVIEITEHGEELVASFQHPELKQEFIYRGYSEEITTHEQIVLKYLSC